MGLVSQYELSHHIVLCERTCVVSMYMYVISDWYAMVGGISSLTEL